MLFNSFEFIIFVVSVFCLYWFIFNKNLNLQNALLLLSGYVFYGWWDYRFLFLLILSSTVDYVVGRLLHKSISENNRKIILAFSICFNISLLGFFKYFNFFADSLAILLYQFGIHVNPRSLNVILPVGISFYTFQSLSYTIDVFKRRMEPTSNPLTFFSFVSFFPQLVAGPIERAIRIIPQFSALRSFSVANATDGMRQILWGFFKKVVLADTCATNVDYIFNNFNNLDGGVLVLGAIFFAFQIYGDFSGYSDIAIGTARLFGFNLMQNFAFPYFSRDIPEFWRRWHISLSTWFRDYLYIPLGGSRGSKLKKIRNILITFTISGFWHGANWTYVFWGFLNGLYYIPLILINNRKQTTSIIAEKSKLPNVIELMQMSLTFILILIAWVFFRATSINEAISYLSTAVTNGLFNISLIDLRGRGISSSLIDSAIAIFIVVLLEWLHRKKLHALDIRFLPHIVRWCIYWSFAFFVLFYYGDERTFIYFQF